MRKLGALLLTGLIAGGWFVNGTILCRDADGSVHFEAQKTECCPTNTRADAQAPASEGVLVELRTLDGDACDGCEDVFLKSDPSQPTRRLSDRSAATTAFFGRAPEPAGCDEPYSNHLLFAAYERLGSLELSSLRSVILTC